MKYSEITKSATTARRVLACSIVILISIADIPRANGAGADPHFSLPGQLLGIQVDSDGAFAKTMQHSSVGV